VTRLPHSSWRSMLMPYKTESLYARQSRKFQLCKESDRDSRSRQLSVLEIRRSKCNLSSSATEDEPLFNSKLPALFVMISPQRARQEITYVVHHYLCFSGLVVRVPGYRSRGPGSILGSTRFPEKWVKNCVHSVS
jgi:hypothetical protein